MACKLKQVIIYVLSMSENSQINCSNTKRIQWKRASQLSKIYKTKRKLTFPEHLESTFNSFEIL